MSARNYNQTLGAGERIILPAGRYFFIRTAASALNIDTIGNQGSPLSFVGVGAGTKVGPLAPGNAWTFLAVTSPAAQAIEIIISDDELFDVANTVTVSGSVAISETPSTAIVTPAADVIANATALAIGANVARRRITLTALAANTGNVFIQSTAAGVGRGIELQPGTFVEVRTTAAIDVRNDSGAAQTITRFEET